MKKNVLLSLFILLGVYEGYSQRYNSEPNYGRNDEPSFDKPGGERREPQRIWGGNARGAGGVHGTEGGPGSGGAEPGDHPAGPMAADDAA